MVETGVCSAMEEIVEALELERTSQLSLVAPALAKKESFECPHGRAKYHRCECLMCDKCFVSTQGLNGHDNNPTGVCV